MPRNVIRPPTLPLLDSVSAPALGALLLAAAAPWIPDPAAPPPPLLPLDPNAPPIVPPEKFPDDLVLALDDIKSDMVSLATATEALDAKPTVNVADRAEDNAFVLFRDWLQALARLPEGNPYGDKARALLKRLFSEGGLDFLRLPVEQERTVADAKLQVIADENLDVDVLFLGGGFVLDHVKTTHVNYGKVIDAAKAIPAELAAVREKLDALLDSLQTYVNRVAGSVKRNKPETKTRAEALLLPLTKWDRHHAKPTQVIPPPITDPGISGASCVPTPPKPATPAPGNK